MPTDPWSWLLLLVIVLIGLIGAWHRRRHPRSSPGAAHLQRLLKPRPPDDCPVCCQHAALTGNPPSRPPVIPWSAVKSRPGAMGRINTQGFACPNRRCAYFRITDAQIHALLGDGAHGRCERIQTLRCQACGATFSTRRSPPLYRLKTASQRVAEVLTALAEGLDVAAAVRVFGYQHATITTWLRSAGAHSETLQDRIFRNLTLPHLQLDELRTRLRSRAHTLWLWVVVDPISKLVPVLHHPEGTRRANPGRRPHGGAYPPPATGAWLHPGLHERRVEPVFLCVDSALWSVGRGGGAAGPPMAGRSRVDLRAGQKDLSAPEVGAGQARDALWNACGTARCPHAAWAEWAVEHRLCRAGESDAAAKRGGPHSADMGNHAASTAVAAASRMVAGLLPFRAPARVAPCAARSAHGSGWQTPAAAIPPADPCHGRWPD